VQSSLAIMQGRPVMALNRHSTERRLHHVRNMVSFLSGGVEGDSFRRWRPIARADRSDMPIVLQALSKTMLAIEDQSRETCLNELHFFIAKICTVAIQGRD